MCIYQMKKKRTENTNPSETRQLMTLRKAAIVENWCCMYKNYGKAAKVYTVFSSIVLQHQLWFLVSNSSRCSWNNAQDYNGTFERRVLFISNAILWYYVDNLTGESCIFNDTILKETLTYRFRRSHYDFFLYLLYFQQQFVKGLHIFFILK